VGPLARTASGLRAIAAAAFRRSGSSAGKRASILMLRPHPQALAHTHNLPLRYPDILSTRTTGFGGTKRAAVRQRGARCPGIRRWIRGDHPDRVSDRARLHPFTGWRRCHVRASRLSGTYVGNRAFWQSLQCQELLAGLSWIDGGYRLSLAQS